MALVSLQIPAVPAHVRTARLVVAAAARRAGLEDGLVDELRLALGEACGRAVLLHASQGIDTPVEVTVRDDPSGLIVAVRDRGPAAPESGPGGDPGDGLLGDLEAGSDAEPADEVGDPDVALAVVRALVDDVAVEPSADGTTVTMRWPLPPRPNGAPSTAAVVDPLTP